MALLVIQLNCLFSCKFKCKTLCRKARLLLSNLIFPFVVIFSVTVSQVVPLVLRTVRKWRFTCTSNKRTHASVKAGTKTDVEMQLKVEFCFWVMFLAHLNNSPKRYIYSFVTQSVLESITLSGQKSFRTYKLLPLLAKGWLIALKSLI